MILYEEGFYDDHLDEVESDDEESDADTSSLYDIFGGASGTAGLWPVFY